MNIAITGASGFIGRHVAARLSDHNIRRVSIRGGASAEDFAGCDAVIHLAGEPVAQRWTRAAVERIRASRVDGTRAVVDLLRANPPKVLISASGSGFYGSRGGESLRETSGPGDDFVAKFTADWEREALAAERFGVRVVVLRISLVLASDGGALAQMLPPFRLGVGGRLGSGRQWMSWIHIGDLTDLIALALENQMRGPVNASSPNPVTNAQFAKELARALHRPAIFAVPKFVLKLMFGEMANVVLASQRLLPEAALNAGFSFRFPELGAALRNLL